METRREIINRHKRNGRISLSDCAKCMQIYADYYLSIYKRRVEELEKLTKGL